MERKDFIEKVGLSGAAILIFGCMQSCSKDSDMTSSPNTPPNSVVRVERVEQAGGDQPVPK